MACYLGLCSLHSLGSNSKSPPSCGGPLRHDELQDPLTCYRTGATCVIMTRTRGPLRHYDSELKSSKISSPAIEHTPKHREASSFRAHFGYHLPFWNPTGDSLGRSHPLVASRLVSLLLNQRSGTRPSQAEGGRSVPASGPLRLAWRPANFHSRQTRIFAGSSARAALGIGPSAASSTTRARSHADYWRLRLLPPLLGPLRHLRLQVVFVFRV